MKVILLHGGPGARGDLKDLAMKLEDDGVFLIEHLQKGMTIDALLDEMLTIIDKESIQPVILIGHSWGAWLGWIFAAQYPEKVKKLILVSTPSFLQSEVYSMQQLRLSRLSAPKRNEATYLMQHVPEKEVEKDRWLAQLGLLMEEADTFQPVADLKTDIQISSAAYFALWPEAERLRKSGQLLRLAQHVCCPVTAIHGLYDSHPAKGVIAPLKKVVKCFSSHEIPDCGHYPWRETLAGKDFLELLQKSMKA